MGSVETGIRTASILDWPETERPRERLLRCGAGALSLAELLAVLIGNGNSVANAMDLGLKVICKLEECGKTVSHLSDDFLMNIKGLGEAKRAGILAGLELGRRAAAYAEKAVPKLCRAEDVAGFIEPHLGGRDEEVMFFIAVDVKNRPVVVREVARGTTEQVAFEPRELFRDLVRVGASGVIFAHNHPSGDPTPSPQDRILTERLRRASELLGIRFLDHVILGRGRHFSMA